MVIIDKSGVHHLKVRCCHYPNAMSSDIQMFQHGFFPASFNRPKTAFTFRVLDDFLLDNLECSTLVMNYYSKLWRMTSSMFPHLVPWRQLKTMKWHGFGHCSDDPKAGDLALFCPACPQPGINICITSSWKYTQSFVMGRNFKAEHLHPIKPHDEVWLSDGLGFMVGKDRYKLHLAEASDTVEKLSCNNHQAINQANAAAQHNMEGITRAITFYNINCQYNKHFWDYRFLEIVSELIIIPGIRLWHVHGHQDSCYVRYASNFIEGIG
ncbi:hypothetical protein BDR04DRAFT_1130030 [Suillus decipiens]|nr:hypothetical protein BDR04DRAFT_1130030 [Suillus decipiens]